jgi:hypothetical protein
MPCDVLQDIYDLLSAGIIVKPEAYFASGWREQPPVLGFLGTIGAEVLNLDASAGMNVLYSAYVPSGEAWVIESVQATNISTAIPVILVEHEYDGKTFSLVQDFAPATNKWSSWTGTITLYAGQRLFAIFGSCVAGDDLYFRYFGRKAFSTV